MKCSSGYELHSPTGLCMPIPITTISKAAQAASTTTTSAVGVCATASVATSVLKSSSPTAMWSLFNQLQMLILLLVVENYVPIDVKDAIIQQDFAMFNFDFIPVAEIPFVNWPTKWIDYEQQNDILKELGLEWQSTFNNLLSLMMMLIIIIFVHAAVKLSPTFKQRKKSKNENKCRRYMRNTRRKVLEYFMYGLYIRLIMEAHQSFLLSGISELDSFSFNSTISIISALFAIIIVTLSVMLVVKAYYMVYKDWSNFDADSKFVFMEFYADIKDNKWARLYTPLLLTRRLLFIIIVLLCGSIGRDAVFSTLLFIQVLYFAVMIKLRPFEELESNIVELTNEAFYLVFVTLMLALDGESMWEGTMTTLFVSLITANSLVLLLINMVFLTITIIQAIKNCRKKQNQKTKVVSIHIDHTNKDEKVSPLPPLTLYSLKNQRTR